METAARLKSNSEALNRVCTLHAVCGCSVVLGEPKLVLLFEKALLLLTSTVFGS